MKKVVFFLIALILLTASPAIGMAAEVTEQWPTKKASAVPGTELTFFVGNTAYYVGDTLKTLDVPPFVREGRTLIPIRFVAEALGGTVAWDQVAKQVTVNLSGTTIKLWIDNAMAEVNGARIPIDSANSRVAPVIERNRTFIPLRFVLEAINSEVIWIPDDKSIIVRYPKPSLVTFENTDYTIDYPENWEKVEGALVGFISPEGNSLNVLFADLGPTEQSITLEEYTSASIVMLYEMYPDVSITQSQPATLAGSPAHKIVYTATIEQLEMQAMQVFTILNNRVYVITYGGPAGLYANYATTAQHMIDSFEVK